MNIQEFRQKYPDYNSIPDQELADSLYKKFYSNIDRDEFDQKFLGTNTKQAKIEQFSNITGIDRTPLDTLKDIAVGVGNVGQNIASTLTGGLAPRVDIQKEIGSKHPNLFIQDISQAIPFGLLGGGAGLLRQIIPAALYGFTQTQPNEENLFGILPQGKLGGTIEGALGGLSLGGIGKAFDLIKRAPTSKATQNFIQSLSPVFHGEEAANTSSFKPGDIKRGATAEENSKRIAESLNTAFEYLKDNALKHKENVLKQVGNRNIEELPGFDISKVATTFEPDVGNITPNKLNSLNKAINQYRKDQQFNKFLEKGESIFDSDLNDKNIDKLEDLVSSRDTAYDKNTDIFDQYDKKTKQIHDAYINNKTLKNADNLIKQLNSKIYSYKNFNKKIPLQPSDYNTFQDYIKAKSDLLDDMNSFMEGKSPALRNEYNMYRAKWNVNVEPYLSDEDLANISKGNTEGITPTKWRSLFSFPDKSAKKILSDLPREAKNYLLYNELYHLKPTDTEGLINALNKLENHKGYSSLITPEIRNFKEDLQNRLTLKNRLLIPTLIHPAFRYSNKIINFLRENKNI